LKDVPRLATFVEAICEALSFDDMVTMQMNLAIEEAVVNVMDYAYPEGVKGYVDIEVWADEQWLTFVITDSGKPFDPTTKGEVDITLSAEERDIGGLGIYLVRQIMDSIGYEYKDGHNVLTLKKKVKG
jgi:sigma-B regulation protein RsbU (phosphoserine phosphatase)